MPTRHAFHPTVSAELESREVLSQFHPIGLPFGPRFPMRVPPVIAPIPRARAALPISVSPVMAKAGPILLDVYLLYTTNGGTIAPIQARYPYLQIQGDAISVSLRTTNPAFLNVTVTALRNLGATIEGVSTPYSTISAYVPIAQLPKVAGVPTMMNLSANMPFLLQR